MKMTEAREYYVRTQIYLFIRDYHQRVNLENIQLLADKKGITPQEMGYAIQVLRRKGAIRPTQKYGWLAR